MELIEAHNDWRVIEDRLRRSFGPITIRNRYVENRKQLQRRAERPALERYLSSSRAFAKKLVQEQNTGKDILPLPLVSSIPNILQTVLCLRFVERRTLVQ